MMQILKSRTPLAFVIPAAMAAVACTPLVIHQWFSSHELCAPVMRLHEVHHVITENHRLLAPWLPDFAFGHGFPFFIYYAPLATYVAEAAHLLGADILEATRISFALSLVLSALSMSAFLSYIDRRYKLEVAPETIAIAATVYVVAPYRMVDVYVRGSIAECWSFVFFPLILLGFHMAASGDRRRGVMIGAGAYAALILSHNIMALYFSAVMCLYVLLVKDTRRMNVLPWIAAIIVIGQALSAFFWIPAVANMSLVGTDAATMWATPDDVTSHAVYWRQFFAQKWGFGLSYPGPDDKMSFAIGWPIVIGCALLPFAAVDRTDRIEGRRISRTLLLVIPLLTVAMTHVVPWRLAPDLFRYIQFPWRLLALVTFFGSMAVFIAMRGVLRWADLSSAAGPVRSAFFVTTLLLVLMTAAPTMRDRPINIGRADRAYVLERVRLEEHEGIIGTTARAEYVPKTAAQYTLDPKWNETNRSESHFVIMDGEGEISGWWRRGAEYRADIECATEVTIVCQSYFFPGWRYWLNEERRDEDMRVGDEGFIHVTVPPGSHRVRFAYGSPPWGRVSQAVSMATLAGMALWVLRGRKER